jgi:hypothetical protein
MNDDKLMQEARQLAQEIRPQRDLWPGISEAIAKPAPRRWTPLLAQAAAVVLLIGASSGVTYMAMQDNAPPPVVRTPEMLFEQASFGNRYSLGPGFQDARSSLVAELEFELQNMSPESRNDIDVNLRLIHDAIIDMNNALAENPENLLLQERLLRTYREELSLLRRVSGLTRNVMMRNDI